jgi:2'-hydroxyisoflavone reductase
VDEQFLLDQGVKPFADLPLWIPQAEKAYAGHFAVDSRRAFASGLICRPLVETAQDTLLWKRQNQVAGKAKSGSNGLSPAQERDLLQRWAGSP